VFIFSLVKVVSFFFCLLIKLVARLLHHSIGKNCIHGGEREKMGNSGKHEGRMSFHLVARERKREDHDGHTCTTMLQ